MLQNLIHYLNLINDLPDDHDWLGVSVEEGSKYLRGSIAAAVDSNACRSLITPEGRPNFQAIAKVEEAGFRVYPGDRDSFEWLTGCIKTNKGVIVFG